MKREIGALALLSLLLLIAVWNVGHADFLTDQIMLNLERSERAVEHEDLEGALIALDNALTLWHDARAYTSVFLRHPDVDDVADAFYDLRQLLLQHDDEAIPAALSRLRYHLDTLDYMEHLSLGTVF